MYSIPAYALRFSAHCRSRLKYLDAGAHDAARGSSVAGLCDSGFGSRRTIGERSLPPGVWEFRVQGANP